MNNTFMTKLVVASLIAVAGVGTAQASFFNFETAATGPHANLSFTDAGVTLALSQNAGVFEVQDITGFGGPASWGVRTLLPETSNPSVMIGNFSQPQAFVGIEAGDFFADTDTITMEAWSGLNGTGILLDTDFIVYPANLGLPGDIASLNVFETVLGSINSVRFFSIGAGGNSNMYFDNMRTRSAVPEPATIAILGLGIVALVRRRRK